MKRKHFRRRALTALCPLLLCAPGWAAQLGVEFEIPAIDTAEYHRPYIAVWVENGKRQTVSQIALWLEQEKWHRDLRSWWRRGGSKLVLPIDGVSGATRKPGRYTVSASADLPPGDYSLNIEAVREVGGREHLRIPFTWPPGDATASARGETELGPVTLTLSEENP